MSEEYDRISDIPIAQYKIIENARARQWRSTKSYHKIPPDLLPRDAERPVVTHDARGERVEERGAHEAERSGMKNAPTNASLRRRCS